MEVIVAKIAVPTIAIALGASSDRRRTNGGILPILTILYAAELNTNSKRKRERRNPLPRLRFGLVSAVGSLTPLVIFVPNC